MNLRFWIRICCAIPIPSFIYAFSFLYLPDYRRSIPVCTDLLLVDHELEETVNIFRLICHKLEFLYGAVRENVRKRNIL